MVIGSVRGAAWELLEFMGYGEEMGVIFRHIKEHFGQGPSKAQGMHPHLRDSMQFLYIKDDVGYEEFLAAVYEAETEGSECKIVSAKAKALTVQKVIENRDQNSLKIIIILLEHFIFRQKRENLLWWELNPMPLICQMSALDR